MTTHLLPHGAQSNSFPAGHHLASAIEVRAADNFAVLRSRGAASIFTARGECEHFICGAGEEASRYEAIPSTFLNQSPTIASCMLSLIGIERIMSLHEKSHSIECNKQTAFKNFPKLTHT
jgi:hypothetical protein